MENKKKDYLTSLLSWADDVEGKINTIKLEKEDLSDWLNKFNDWKLLVEEKKESDDEITDESIEDLQIKSEKLLNSLTELLNKPRQADETLKPGNHKLPPLPYAYDALEPYISKKIMQLHHDKHHQSYVDGLNKAEKELYKSSPDDKLIKHWMREQAFNGSGHYLHTIFWENMSPKGGGLPDGILLSKLKKDFGSFEKFQTLFSKAAESVEGVGWAILLWEPRAARLGVQTVEKHQMFSLWDTVPLLVLDVWEHAYYLQYENKRAEYIQNWWEIVNWKNVKQRLEKAQKLQWPLY
ncbi:superoxide dismutase [Aquibacillus halophilus]|uniref:superoxide dismutase n=1 Tax=Aquibacillus halophilus TaxID=930132 RepID=A0A6A8DAL6_9BACI|nr:superoxide dismutase [Aquibacillus halophilus]MRH42350.1 superoxide dismutase [Aquibacillus halophilus]